MTGLFTYRWNGLADIKGILIHHTAADADSTPARLDELHRVENGWSGIGYHAQSTWAGNLNLFGDVRTVRAHIAHRNHEWVGIVLNGDLDRPSRLRAASVATAGWYVAAVRTLLGWKCPIFGHGDMAVPSQPTACPGALWPAWKADIEVAAAGADVWEADLRLLVA